VCFSKPLPRIFHLAKQRRTVPEGEQHRAQIRRSGGAVASGSIKDLKLVGVALATQRGKNGCGEREFQSELQGRKLLLAMADPATHPALFSADFAATFTSTTTGHAFSSGLSETLVSMPSQHTRFDSEESYSITNRRLGLKGFVAMS
jgi:hypothetical protein